jgi:hypothetical protein
MFFNVMWSQIKSYKGIPKLKDIRHSKNQNGFGK